MELRIMVLVAIILFCNKASAQAPAWIIQPNICVTQQVGEMCQLTFNIETQDMPPGVLCLFLNGELLTCSQQGYFYNKISISIAQDSQLELKDNAQKVVLSKTLQIKYLEPHNQRRRIRPPWSLF
jgi:hypothetical protein